MSGFLTKADIKQLTGLPGGTVEERIAQVAWLRDHHVRHFINAADKIVVTWGAVDGQTADPPKAWSPDFSELRGA